MLNRLDQIPWSELSHAYGEAEDVPELLRGLASPEEEVREDALYALYGNIWHQGTVYEATAYAVPFLIELLTLPEVEVKAEILGLLHSLTQGSSYLDVHQHFDSYRNERETEEFQSEREQELRWVHAAHDAVADGVPVYIDLLSHPETAVRTTAPYLLASCVEQGEQIAPLLTAHAAREEEPVAKASLLFALACLRRGSGSQQDIRLLSSVYTKPTEAPVVRFMAALGAALLGGEPVLAETLTVLRETAPACSNNYSELPWDLGESPVSAVSAVLVPHPRIRLRWLLEMLEHQDADVRSTAIEEACELCREQRFASSAVVVPLARLVADPEWMVRDDAADALPTLGSARLRAIPILEELSRHTSADIRILAEKTLTKVQVVRDAFDLKKWLKEPKEQRSISECIAILESAAPAPTYQDAAITLEIIGPAAITAVPALRKALNHDSHWVRVRAARALWKITQDPTDSLPILQQEIQCRPAGLLALDCLGDMGSAAAPAIPALRQIIDSEVRLVEVGSVETWVDEDEAFCAAAQRALRQIKSALDAKPNTG